MSFRKITALLLALLLILTISAGCGKKEPETKNLTLFAPSQSLAVVLPAVELFSSQYQNIRIGVSLNGSDVNAAKIEGGYDCDVFISDIPACMDWLDSTKDSEANPNGNNCIITKTRTNLYVGPTSEEYQEAGGEATSTYCAAAVKGTDYEEEVKLFIDFLTSERCQQLYEENGCTLP